MKAFQIKIGNWFMVLRTKKWYKKTGQNKTYVEATQIGKLPTFNIPMDENVEKKPE